MIGRWSLSHNFPGCQLSCVPYPQCCQSIRTALRAFFTPPFIGNALGSSKGIFQSIMKKVVWASGCSFVVSKLSIKGAFPKPELTCSLAQADQAEFSTEEITQDGTSVFAALADSWRESSQENPHIQNSCSRSLEENIYFITMVSFVLTYIQPSSGSTLVGFKTCPPVQQHKLLLSGFYLKACSPLLICLLWLHCFSHLEILSPCRGKW